LGGEATMFIHVTLLPFVGPTKELKTKPTQHSVKELRSIGIQPDVIVARSDYPVPEELKDKIALFCDVDRRAVIPLETADSIYEVPLVLEEAGLGAFVVERLGLEATEPDLAEWRDMVARAKADAPTIKIGVVGKYVGLEDAYISVRESLHHSAWHHRVRVSIEWIDAQLFEAEGADAASYLAHLDGIVVPGGFGYRGVEGMVEAARFAREHQVPYLGLCLGMQVMVIELARNRLGMDDANSAEFNLFSRHPVIDILPEQKDISEKGGTMRLGQYPCQLAEGSRALAAYQQPIVFERHRHRYELNNEYRAQLEGAGLVTSGLSPDGRLVEIGELVDHPWMLGTQFHPELKSRPNRPHPLFRDFIGAVAARAGVRRNGAVHAAEVETVV
ncbi:MAG: CTP synthase, partial [Chloroflexota bacterium]